MEKIFGHEREYSDYIRKRGCKERYQNRVGEHQYTAAGEYNNNNGSKYIDAHKRKYVIAKSLTLIAVLLNILNLGFKTIDFRFKVLKLNFLAFSLNTDASFGCSIFCKAVENIFLFRHISILKYLLQQLFDSTILLYHRESRCSNLVCNTHPKDCPFCGLKSQVGCRTFLNNASTPSRQLSLLLHLLIRGHETLAYNRSHSIPLPLFFQLLVWREIA